MKADEIGQCNSSSVQQAGQQLRSRCFQTSYHDKMKVFEDDQEEKIKKNAEMPQRFLSSNGGAWYSQRRVITAQYLRLLVIPHKVSSCRSWYSHYSCAWHLKNLTSPSCVLKPPLWLLFLFQCKCVLEIQNLINRNDLRHRPDRQILCPVTSFVSFTSAWVSVKLHSRCCVKPRVTAVCQSPPLLEEWGESKNKRERELHEPGRAQTHRRSCVRCSCLWEWGSTCLRLGCKTPQKTGCRSRRLLRSRTAAH